MGPNVSMYNVNKMGPRMEPRGTADGSRGGDKVSFRRFNSRKINEEPHPKTVEENSVIHCVKGRAKVLY